MTILKITDVANRLNTSVSQVRHLMENDKDFPCFAYGSKTIRFSLEDIDKWILQQKQKPIPVVKMKKKGTTKAKAPHAKPAQA